MMLDCRIVVIWGMKRQVLEAGWGWLQLYPLLLEGCRTIEEFREDIELKVKSMKEVISCRWLVVLPRICQADI